MISEMSYGAGAASDPRFIDQDFQTKLWMYDQIPTGTILGLKDYFDEDLRACSLMEVGCGRTAYILEDRKQSRVETEKDGIPPPVKPGLL